MLLFTKFALGRSNVTLLHCPKTKLADTKVMSRTTQVSQASLSQMGYP